MENFEIVRVDKGFEIHGIPEAVKVVRIDDDARARRLGDLALHRSDLEFAAECLEAINQVADTPRVAKEALWRSAIVHYMKCFGDAGARFQLDAAKVYKNQPALTLTVFAYFKDLRNKHLIHDENSYAQSITGAALNNGTKPYKVEKIVCTSFIAGTLVQDNYANLHRLAHVALDWVTAEFDTLCNAISHDLESQSYEELLAREAPQYTVPTLDELSTRRSARQ